MRSVLLVTAAAAFVAILCPDAAAASTGATAGGPLTRAALAMWEEDLAKSPPPPSVKSRTDWSRVTRLRPLLAARTAELQLPRDVRANPAGVFLGEQRVADLADVIRAVPRAQVTDIRVRRKHIGAHSRRGLLSGAAIGAGLGAAFAATCEGDCEVLPVTGLGALVGGVYGLEFGTVVGLIAPRSPDVIYHAD